MSKLRLLDGEIILDYLVGPSVFTRVLKSGKGIGRENQRPGGMTRTQPTAASCEDGGTALSAEECRWLLDASKGKEMDSPG